jgi:hypothetical protein
VVPKPCLAEVLLQKRKGLLSQICACLNAERTHLDGRLWTHAVEVRHRQGRNKRLRLVRHDRVLAVSVSDKAPSSPIFPGSTSNGTPAAEMDRPYGGNSGGADSEAAFAL